jgi:hypothetical protein
VYYLIRSISQGYYLYRLPKRTWRAGVRRSTRAGRKGHDMDTGQKVYPPRVSELQLYLATVAFTDAIGRETGQSTLSMRAPSQGPSS